MLCETEGSQRELGAGSALIPGDSLPGAARDADAELRLLLRRARALRLRHHACFPPRLFTRSSLTFILKPDLTSAGKFTGFYLWWQQQELVLSLLMSMS